MNVSLTALSSRSLSDQRHLLSMTASRTIINQVNVDSSSLLCLNVRASFRSTEMLSSNRSSLLSRAFTIDHELLSSRVYQRQIRSLMRQVVHNGKSKNRNSYEVPNLGTRRESRSETTNPKEIQHRIRRDKLSEVNDVKLLLLGARGNERSTVLDTMQLLQIEDYDPHSRKSYWRIPLSSCIPDALNAIMEVVESTVCSTDASIKLYIYP